MVAVGLIMQAVTRDFIFFGSKMDKRVNKSLTNQPETGTVPPLVSSRVVGCWRVVAKAVFDAKQPVEMDESEIFVSGRVGSVRAKSEEVEAAMTLPGELALTLGVGTTTAARGRLKPRLLLRNNGRFSLR